MVGWMFGLRDPVGVVTMLYWSTKVVRWVWSEERRRVPYPDVEVEVLVFYCLDVEPYGWYRCDYLANLRRMLTAFIP